MEARGEVGEQLTSKRKTTRTMKMKENKKETARRRGGYPWQNIGNTTTVSYGENLRAF
jgi:hypothetical protein